MSRPAGSSPASTPRWWAPAALVALAAIVLLVLHPLIRAGWHGDDWGWLAVAVHAGVPLPAFVESHMFGYYYRPTSAMAWWLATAVAGIEPAKHYAVTLLLHAAGAAAAGGFVRALTGSMRRGFLAAVLVAVAPPVAGMALWLSNRSEALVLVFGFLAMRLALAGTDRAPRALLVALALWLAATAKETGLAFVPAVALLMVGEAGWRGLRHPARVAALLLPLALALLPRPFVARPFDAPLALGDLPRLFVDGGIVWAQRLPQALGGWGEAGVLSAVVTALALALALAGAVRLAFEGRRWPALALGALVVLAALAQSPITARGLGDPAALQFLVNLRYFAVGAAGLAVLAACAIPVGTPRPRDLAFAVGAVALALAWGQQSHRQAQRWAEDTRRETAGMLDGLAAADLRPGCPPPFASEAFPAGLRGYADLLYKVQLPPGDPRLSCTVSVAGDPAGITLLPRAACDDVPTVADWRVLERDGRRFVEPFGAVCQVVYQRVAVDGGRAP